MKVDLKKEDFEEGPHVAHIDDAIWWKETDFWLWLNLAERKSFLHEWLEAEEDHSEGRYLEILQHLASERGFEVSERDPGPQAWCFCGNPDDTRFVHYSEVGCVGTDNVPTRTEAEIRESTAVLRTMP